MPAYYARFTIHPDGRAEVGSRQVMCLHAIPCLYPLNGSVKARLKEFDRFWEKEQTKAEVQVFILDEVYASLPKPPFTAEEKEAVAAEVYTHVWQQAVRGEFVMAA